MSGWKEIAVSWTRERVIGLFKELGATVTDDFNDKAKDVGFKVSVYPNNVVIVFNGYKNSKFKPIKELIKKEKPELMITFDGNDTTDTGEWYVYEYRECSDRLEEREHKQGEQEIGGWNGDITQLIQSQYSIIMDIYNTPDTQVFLTWDSEEKLKEKIKDYKVIEAF